MKLLTAAGPLDQFNEFVSACVIDRSFHPEYAMRLMKSLEGLSPMAYSNPFTKPLHQAEDLAERAGIDLAHVPFALPTDEQAGIAYLDDLNTRLGQLEQEKEHQLHIAQQSQEIAEKFEHLRGLSGNLDDLWDFRFARFRYGYLPRENYDSFLSQLSDNEDVLFFPTSIEARQVYGIYFTTERTDPAMSQLFASLHFVNIQLDVHPRGTAEEAIAQLRRDAEAAMLAAADTEHALERLSLEEREKLLSFYSYLRYYHACCDLQRYAARSQDTFYLSGWVPEDEEQAMTERFTCFQSVSMVVDEADTITEVKPPTKLKNPFFGRIFRPFLEMYGLPAYNELDPSIFMSITYCLFFGIMFGDIGQGLCLALAGIFMTKVRKMWLGNILTCCGLSGAVFGCVYGTVFGFEDLLPGFKILEDGNVMLLLMTSLGLGMVMLALVMVLNILNGIRQKNFEKIIFGPNGLAGMVFYLGLIFAALCRLLLGVNLFVPVYIIPVLVLPLVLILLKEPLSKLCARDPTWKDISLGELLGVGFFELFETLLSYLTNTLSFLRIGAYAITHVGLMLVVHMLAGSGNIPILIVGNIFVMGFEGLLVCIQVLRLEFYELFGRFYDDGGVPFQPKIIDYSTRSN